MRDTVPADGSSDGAVPGFCAARSRGRLLVAAILASSLGFIDGTVVAITLPDIRASLGASLGQTQWFQNGYMLSLTALMIVGGGLGDRYGVARIFGTGIVLFLAASLLCGIATGPGGFIAARIAQGVGAALMVPGSLALIARAYPPAERGRAIGIWAAASAVTTAAGPILGGLLLGTGWEGAWRAIFLMNLPLGAIALWLLARHVAADPPSASSARLDLPGAVLATLALGCLAAGLTAGEHGQALGARDLGLIAAGLAAGAAFVIVERRVADPMVPPALFARPGFAAANLATFTLYAGLTAILFFLPMTVIAGWGHPPLAAALVFLPLSVFIGLISPRAGRLADRIGPARPIAAGSALVALGYVAMAVAAPAQAFWAGIVPGAVLLGLGMSLVVAPLSTAVMGAAGPDAAGIASGVNNAVSRGAGLVSVAALGPVVAAIYATAGGPASFGEVSSAAPAPEVGHEVAHQIAMSSAFATVAAIAAGLTLASAALALAGLRGLRPDPR